MNQLVTFLTEEKRGSENAINEILLSNHPAMEQIKDLLKIPYRVYFTNKDEFYDLIRARSYRKIENDNPFDDFEIWICEKNSTLYTLRFDPEIFNNDKKLKIFTKEEWHNENMTVTEVEVEDDLPF